MLQRAETMTRSTSDAPNNNTSSQMRKRCFLVQFVRWNTYIFGLIWHDSYFGSDNNDSSIQMNLMLMRNMSVCCWTVGPWGGIKLARWGPQLEDPWNVIWPEKPMERMPGGEEGDVENDVSYRLPCPTLTTSLNIIQSDTNIDMSISNYAVWTVWHLSHLNLAWILQSLDCSVSSFTTSYSI